MGKYYRDLICRTRRRHQLSHHILDSPILSVCLSVCQCLYVRPSVPTEKVSEEVNRKLHTINFTTFNTVHKPHPLQLPTPIIYRPKFYLFIICRFLDHTSRSSLINASYALRSALTATAELLVFSCFSSLK